MHYLVASREIVPFLTGGCRTVADGETLSFEEPWSFGAPTLVRAEDAAALDAIRAQAGPTMPNAFAVEGFAEPGAGRAFVVAAHLMRDVAGFQPYAAAVPDVIGRYGGRFLARGGKVTPLSGSFVPDRVVLIEFPSAEDVTRFYFSADYAPLLQIRLATTDPRFVLVARSGDLSDRVRDDIAARLRPGR